MNTDPNDMSKGLLESQDAVLYSTQPMLSVTSALASATLQFIRNPQTLQWFLSPL